MKMHRVLNLSLAALLATATSVAAMPGMAESGNAGKMGQSQPIGSKGAAAAKDAKITVGKAKGANAYTVEGAFVNSAKLDKQKIVVRGKVVKVSNGIMGKNWVHLQDGTGSAAKGTHDLVCTTKEKLTVGDVVTVTGTLAKDRDFGSGYRYSSIIEDASFRK